MAQTQACLGEGHARHGGGCVDPQPHLGQPTEGGGQIRKHPAEGFLGQGVGDGGGIPGHEGLQGMRQHIKARVRDEGGRQALQKGIIQNRRLRAQFGVYQGMLYGVVGQDGEIRHL